VARVGSGDVVRASLPNSPPATPVRAWSATAFGLVISGSLRLESLVPARAARTPDTWLERAPRGAVDARWRSARPETLLERRLTDGSVGLSVHQDWRVGLRVWAPRHGCYLVANDGRRVIAAPPSGPAWRWERLVLAHVLPLAAVLRGMEVLHASAVALEGRAVAFLGRSGAGKSTLAGRLLRGGARLVTDDVLALTSDGGTVWAHRGAAVARMDPREVRSIPPRERASLGEVEVRGDKWHVRPAAGPTRAPLAMAYHLDRAAGNEGVMISAVRPSDPVLLLGNAFLPYLNAPVRLRRQLDVLAAVAAGVPLFQIRAGAGVGPAAVADAVLPHARSVLAGHSP
jgi:hypothetical protein